MFSMPRALCARLFASFLETPSFGRGQSFLAIPLLNKFLRIDSYIVLSYLVEEILEVLLDVVETHQDGSEQNWHNIGQTA